MLIAHVKGAMCTFVMPALGYLSISVTPVFAYECGFLACAPLLPLLSCWTEGRLDATVTHFCPF